MSTFLKVILLALFCACSTGDPSSESAMPHVARLVLPKRSAPRPTIEKMESPDPRTHQQIAQVACFGGKCTGTQVKPTSMASAGSPIIPPSWTVPLWEIDAANSIGCASDTNSGTSATCVGGCFGATCPSGVGPLLTCQELITHRWGCNGASMQCPRIRQSTTVQWTSSSTNAADTCYFNPAVEVASSTFLLQGVPSTVCSGTLSGRVPKNRATPQLLNFTLCAAAAQDEFVVNSTRGSGAFTYKLVSGTTWALSQPLPTQAVPWTGIDPVEDDTWANGDSYTVETFPTVNLATYRPIQVDATGAIDQVGYIQHLTISAPSLDSMLFLGSPVLIESVDDRFTEFESYSATGINLDIEAPVTATARAGHNTPGLKAGILRPPSFTLDTSFYYEAGIILSSTGSASITNFNGSLNDVYIDASMVLNVTGFVTANTYSGLSAPFIWGGGALDVQPSASLFINAATATPTLLVTTILLDGLPTACSQTNAKPSVINCGITVSGTNIDAVASATGFGGIALNPNGASINTLSSPF